MLAVEVEADTQLAVESEVACNRGAEEVVEVDTLAVEAAEVVGQGRAAEVRMALAGLCRSKATPTFAINLPSHAIPLF
jgi:hypothetical protein